MRPTATRKVWTFAARIVNDCGSGELGHAQCLAEAAAAVERVAVLAMPRGVMGGGQQQAAALGIAVLAVVLEHAERDLLVVRVVAQPRTGERQRAHQRRR